MRRNRKHFHRNTGLIAVALSLLAETAAGAQTEPWFGLPAPGPATEQVLEFDGLDFKQLPAPPVGKETQFDGRTLYDEMKRITQFSYLSRDAGDRLWGRVAGSPANEAAIHYVLEQFKAAGLVDVQKVPVPFEAPEALPQSWSVEVLGMPEFGSAGQTVTLQSALPRAAQFDGQPLRPDQREAIEKNPTRTLTAPLVYAGDGGPAALASVDLKGKIVVTRLPANPAHFYNEQFYVGPRAAINAGAAAVLVILEGPGNMQARVGSCYPQICFNLGAEDGAFLEALFAKSGAAGLNGKLQARLTVTETVDPTRASHMIIGRVKGKTSKENIVINAHSDGWFAGAADNAVGVAGLLAMARHYARPANKPRHDIYFVLGAGHHSPTKDTLPLVRFDPEIPTHNVAMVNLEHFTSIGIAKTAFGILKRDPPRDRYGNILFPFVPTNWDTQLREVSLKPISRPLIDAWEQSAQKYLLSGPAEVLGEAASESTPFTRAGGAAINNVEANLWYHTSGDTAETIAPEGLQRSLLFFRDFVDRVDKLNRADIQPAAPTP